MKKFIAVLFTTFLLLGADQTDQGDVTAFVSGDITSVKKEFETVDGEVSVEYRIIPTAFAGYQ